MTSRILWDIYAKRENNGLHLAPDAKNLGSFTPPGTTPYRITKSVSLPAVADNTDFDKFSNRADTLLLLITKHLSVPPNSYTKLVK